MTNKVPNESEATEKLFSPAMARKELGISRSYYEKLLDGGKLRASYQSEGGQRRFTKGDIDRFKAGWKRASVRDQNKIDARRGLSDGGLAVTKGSGFSVTDFQKSFLTYRELGLSSCHNCWRVAANLLSNASDCDSYAPEADCRLLSEMRATWRDKILKENKFLTDTDAPLVQAYVRNLVICFMCESYLSKRSVLFTNVGPDKERIRQTREYLKQSERDAIRLAGILCLTPASRKKGGGTPSEKEPTDPFGGA